LTFQSILSPDIVNDELHKAGHELENIHRWTIRRMQSVKHDLGLFMLFHVDEIENILMVPFHNFLHMVEECYFLQQRSLSDELHTFFEFAKEHCH